MYKDAFLNFSDGDLVVVGFILFMGVFLGSLAWTLVVRKKSFYSELAQIPLEDGDQHG